jgi:hypothetical protein
MKRPLSNLYSEMMGKATRNQDIADELVNMFTDPVKAHSVFFKF